MALTGPTPDPSAIVDSVHDAPVEANRWRRLTRRDVVSLSVCLGLLLVLVLPKLPPGICVGDTGELQLVSSTLGITHAPGYPAYASIGYLATLVPFLDPAYAVTLASFATGLLVFALCALTQMRLGVPTPLAVTLTLLFLWPNRTWINLVAAEVYTPTLALQAASVYLMMRYESRGRRRDLATAAFCFGLALASRPPVAFALPLVLLGWWQARKRWATGWGAIGRSLTLVVFAGAIPGLYSLAYLYVRDTPQTAYNYIHLHDTEYNLLPDVSEGPRAKWERVLWHVSGREFSYAFNHDWRYVGKKLYWLRSEFFLSYPLVFLTICALVAVGALKTWRRFQSAFWMMSGMIASVLIFICSYRMIGQAADYFPLLWIAFIWFGVAVSPLFVRRAEDSSIRENEEPVDRRGSIRPFLRRFGWLVRAHGGTVAFAIVAAITIVDTPQRSTSVLSGDATDFVKKMEIATLPPDAVICAAWPETPVIFYAKYVLSSRDDITLISASVDNWPRMLAPFRGRPIFAASPARNVPGFVLSPYRNLSRMEPADIPRG